MPEKHVFEEGAIAVMLLVMNKVAKQRSWRRYWLPMGVVFAVVVVALAYLYLSGQVFLSVPKSVRSAYDQAQASIRGGGFGGARLSVCRKSFSVIYEVKVGYGFGGGSTYFTRDGEFLDSSTRSDDGSGTSATINLQGFKCETLESMSVGD